MTTNVKLAALWLLFAFSCCAEVLSYDPDRRVAYRPDSSYTRDEYSWWISNTHSESRLFQNGNYVSSEFGTNDLAMFDAWAIQPNASNILVGLVGSDDHGVSWLACVTNAAPGTQLMFYNAGHYTPWGVATGIEYCRTNGARIIVIGYGTSSADASLFNACQAASDDGVPVLCPMREDGTSLNVDSFPDYPSAWAATIELLIPITGTARNGQRHGVCGYGTNSLAAPFRNIVSTGSYISGTSESSTIAAGLLALVAARFPYQSADAWVQAVRFTAIPTTGTRRINPVAALNAPTPWLTITGNNLTIHGLTEFLYTVERSNDLQEWTFLEELNGNATIAVDEGFYRAVL